MQTLILKLKAEQVRKVRSFFSEELLLSASVLFLPVLYMTAAFALLSDIGLGRWVFPAGLSLWGIAVVALHREERWHRLLATLLLFLVIFALAAWALSFTLDRGHDSRLYHAEAILGLLKGINPYWQPADWTTLAYPAAHWLLSSSLIVWTQTFEASFAFTLVATFAAFLCVRRFLATPTLSHLSCAKSRVWRNLLAVALAANPIATLGFFNHLTDGLLASTLLSLFMLMLCFACDGGSRQDDKRRMRRTAFGIAALLVLLVNIKFTGIVFGGVLGLTALAYGARRAASRKTLLRLAGLGSAAAVLGVALFGFFPYATNVAQDKNPFYPAVQFDEQGIRIDTLAQWMEPEFYNKSSYEKWWISLFSKNGKNGWDPAPLPPFSSLSARSFQYGFSSFFSGALLLCLTLAFFVRQRGAWIVLAGVMASILSTSASFEFRLTPQNWWLPLLLLAFLFEGPDNSRSLGKSLSESLPRAPLLMARSIVGCLFAIALIRFLVPGLESVMLKRTAGEMEKEGGWHATGYFDYYNSGLTGMNLPALRECPPTAERRHLNLFLSACRP